MSDLCYVVRNKTKRGKSIYTITHGERKVAVIDASDHKSNEELRMYINAVILTEAFDASTAEKLSTLAMLDLGPGRNGIATYTVAELFDSLLDAKPHGDTKWWVRSRERARI